MKLPLDNVKKVWNKQGCDFLLKNSKNINISTVRAVAPADLPTTDTDSAVNVEVSNVSLISKEFVEEDL